MRVSLVRLTLLYIYRIEAIFCEQVFKFVTTASHLNCSPFKQSDFQYRAR